NWPVPMRLRYPPTVPLCYCGNILSHRVCDEHSNRGHVGKLGERGSYMPEDRQSRISVLVVDDKELFREGLVSLLSRRPEIAIVGQAEDGFQALEMARQLQPQIILMDVDMPNCRGVRATQLIKEE